MEVLVEELGDNDGVRDGLVEAFVGVADDEKGDVIVEVSSEKVE